MFLSQEGQIYNDLCEQEHASEYKVYFFGQFRLLHNDQSLTNTAWRRNKAKLLLKWFLLNPNKIFSSDQLIDLFWPDLQVEAALRNLHVTVHYLRRMLEPCLGHRQKSSFLHRSKQNFYCFEQSSAWWTDITAIRLLYESAKELDRQAQYEKAVFHFQKIVAFCKGGFLPEDTEVEAFDESRRYFEQIHYQALLRLIHYYLEHEKMEEVLEHAYQALRIERYSEVAIQAVAHVYYRKGDTATAIDKLHQFQESLQRELGLEPSNTIFTLKALLEKD